MVWRKQLETQEGFCFGTFLYCCNNFLIGLFSIGSISFGREETDFVGGVDLVVIDGGVFGGEYKIG